MTVTPRVLVVDDDEDIRDMLKLLLETEGYEVAGACDGQDALRQLADGLDPALLLVDLMMPLMDGEQLMRALQRSPWADMPAVILSGHEAAARMAARLGADMVLTKPIEIEELLEVTHRLAPTAPLADRGQAPSRTAPGDSAIPIP